jgi:hypothetical protein
LVRRLGDLRQPDRRLAARLLHVVGEPLELLAVAVIERQRDEPVEKLRRPEPLQLAPERDPRRRRLAWQPKREQDPTGPVRPLRQPRLHALNHARPCPTRQPDAARQSLPG